ncbi:MAG: Eco57I restriction-modification methylase domain-containing protein [Pseudomonadota bacterium]|nr:Eco57I restriction-modification methylase domain-containing protein [Pseudomonadota bacterium]
MAMLFDNLGPEWRSPDVVDAIRSMADIGDTGRGAIFTRPEVVTTILDLSGYTADRPLHQLRLLEPAFGDGDFLRPAVERLLSAYGRHVQDFSNIAGDLRHAIRAVEIHPQSVLRTGQVLQRQLVDAGVSAHDAKALADSWLLCDDFLLCGDQGLFDFVIGNPPYVRQERIPAPLLAEYRARFRTLYDRADLYVPFYERALDQLTASGVLGFICANRWLKNKYGGPLRHKITEGFHLSHYVDMENFDSFLSNVIAYPAITIIKRVAEGIQSSMPTRVAAADFAKRFTLSDLSRAMQRADVPSDLVDEVTLSEAGDSPWLLDDLRRLRVLRRIESMFPAIEQAGCKVGIGVATGCDRVFIQNYDELPVEDERKLPLVMAGDLVGGHVRWSGKGVLNPFLADGSIAALASFPRFAAYIESHRDVIARRHVANRSGDGWYRTIDRIYPELVARPKLLIPDIKGEASFVLDDGNYYPHHNLYFVTSESWDLRALQTVLRSSLSVMTVATYCTRMAGGFLRFQAQYLRRIRLPTWDQVPDAIRAELIAAAGSTDIEIVNAPVFRLYGLSPIEAQHVAAVARAAQVTSNRRAVSS